MSDIIFYLPVFEAIQVLEEVGNAAHFSLGVAKMSSLDQFCQEAIWVSIWQLSPGLAALGDC